MFLLTLESELVDKLDNLSGGAKGVMGWRWQRRREEKAENPKLPFEKEIISKS